MSPFEALTTGKINKQFVETWSVPEPNSGCWIWLGCADRNGYGLVSRYSYGESLAHRYSYRAYRNEDIRGLYVCHKCDNPSCVNPDHLFLGTQRDNMRDCARKGRTSRSHGQRGADNGLAVLTDDAVREARRRYSYRHPTNNAVALAAEFGVSKSVMANALKGKTWSHVK